MIRLEKRTVGSIGLLTVVLLAVIAGGGVSAATAQENRTEQTYTAETTVAENGSIESFDLFFVVDSQTYENYTTVAKFGGYDTVDGWFEASYEEMSWVNNASVTTTERADRHALSISLFNISPDGPPSVNVTTEGDSIAYRATLVSNPANKPRTSKAVHRVTMPGEITDTNADESNLTTATWNLHETYTSELYVEADVSANAASENGTDESDGTDGGGDDDSNDSDSVSGFTPLFALVALCLAALLGRGRRAKGR